MQLAQIDGPPALAPVTVAQFILESDWGRAHMGVANNYFGIKASDTPNPLQPVVTRQTREFIGGRWTTVFSKFKAYDSMAACFQDHARLICEGAWKHGDRAGTLIYADALSHPDDPIAFAHALTGVYATDPDYGAKLEQVMRENDLLTEFGFSADRGGETDAT